MRQPLLQYIDKKVNEEKVLAHDPQQNEKYHAKLLKEIIANRKDHQVTDISDFALDIITHQMQLVKDKESYLWDTENWSYSQKSGAFQNVNQLCEQWQKKSETDEYQIRYKKLHWILRELLTMRG